MALVVKDRVKETTATTGTGTLQLSGAIAGFQSFTSALSNGDTTYYAIVESSTGAWEVGLGTFTSTAPGFLARTTILSSSNSGSAINLTQADAEVFITQPAGKSAYFDASGNFNATTATTLATARTINGTSFNGSANITITANTTNTLTRGSYLTGSNFNGSAATTWAVDATSANTASKVVARDASGNFSAGTITAALSGNATTATTLATARTINGVSFNGSANITVADSTKLPLSGGTMTGSINMGNLDITGVNNLSIGDPGPNEGISWAGGNLWKIYESPNDLTTNTAGNLQVVQNATRRATFNTSGQIEVPVATGTAPFSISSTTRVSNLNVATAGTADTLTTARTINGTSFNGSANITITANTTNTLTRGSYLTGSNFNGSAATTWAVDATSANTASKVVARDASGNFSAGTITAALSGNATTATTLQTARTINGVSFNGSANITVEPYVEDAGTASATRYVTFVDNSTAGYKRLNEDADLTYNPGTNTLSAIVMSATEVVATGAVKEGYVALSGTTPSIDVDAGGGFSLTTSGNTTFTFASFTTAKSCGFVLQLTAGGTHTITWPASVDWAGGTAPDAPASGATNIYVFWSRDGGTTWYGVLSSAAAA